MTIDAGPKDATAPTPAQGPGSRRVDLVPHTHWDREWYLPFQRLRLRLVDVLDELLADLAADPSFSHFLLDGQLAAVDDYLELRPEQEATIAALNRQGRVAVGPWYTLPDEFLVSGETLIRNLEMGMDRADEFGGPMAVGYLPDMFGHVAQMPQLLALAGFEHAVVWRGVPASIGRTGFWWVAPDGTRVRVEYLPAGYGNGAKMPLDPAEFAARLESWIASQDDIIRPGEAVLWMNGTDHLPHQHALPEVVAAVNALDGDALDVRIVPLAQHLTEATTADLPTWRGELRSSSRFNLLFGVGSNRVDVRQAAARAERALEQVAEPLWAALLPPSLWPERALHVAWREVVRNAAHDSVCACSDDEVVATVLSRYAEARQIADGLVEHGLKTIGAALAGVGPVVVNTLARRRGGLVELTRAGHEPGPHEQLLESIPPRRLVAEMGAAAAPVRLEAELDVRPPVHGVRFADGDDGALDVEMVIDPTKRGRFPAQQSVAKMQAIARATPERHVRLHLADDARRRVLVCVGGVPGLGWAPPTMSPGEVRATARTLDNGLLTVEADEATGTYAVDGLDGLGRLVDDGDAGDTYNYNPPDHDVIVDAPELVEVHVVERGPLRARLRIDARYRWPRRVDDETLARVGEEEVEVSTLVELRGGERFVRVATTIDNRCEDHRVRAWFPLPQRTDRSEAECAFTTVTRGLTVESGPTEVALPTYPSRRFVRAGGLTIAHEGLLEHELVDRDQQTGTAGALAVTLLRANRYLSRGPMSLRPMPAGPIIELHGSQVPGRHTLRYALALGAVDPFVLADDAFVPLLVAQGAGLGEAPDEHQGLDVDGAAVSAVRRRRGRLEVRVFNPTAAAATVTIAGRTGTVVDLRGRPQAGFDGTLELRPAEIATIALDELG